MLSSVPKETGTFTFNVRANDAVAKVTLSIDSGATHTYSQNPVPRFSLSVGGGPALRTQLQGGTLAQVDALPPGLTLTPDGKLSGGPINPWLYQVLHVVDRCARRYGDLYLYAGGAQPGTTP